MKAKDIFGIILRTVALWVGLWGAWQTLAALIYLPASIQSLLGGGAPRITSFTYFGYGLPALAGALLVLRFASAIVWFTYRE